jgi:competence protein ComEC
VAAGRPPALILLGIAAVATLAIVHSDEVRERASLALGRGMPPREAELARGFVLGEDEHVDAATVEDFRRSGLSHLLAVSGQNVALLALLANALLAALAIPLRTRLLWLLALIAAYVPLAGAAPSIQRAAVMGGLNVLAMLVGRRTSRLYALGLAAALTLAIEPRIAEDVGWQLSFAAVLGILLLGAPLRAHLEPLLGGGPLGRSLCEVAALTAAATLATAPLIAMRFGELSTTTLAANLLAAPAVAPSMWLGMIGAGAAQIPGAPVEPVNWLNALLLGYVAQVAAWCGRPSWASIEVELGATGLLASYLGIALLAAALRRLRIPSHRRTSWRPVLAVATALALALALPPPAGTGSAVSARPEGLRVSVLDVGQGDAILLQPPAAPAVLVDGGPFGDDLVGRLRERGVEWLGAVVATHDQSDHTGGIAEVIGGMPIGRLLYGALGRRMLAEAKASGVTAQQIARGDELRSGALRLEVLWPPRELLEAGRAAADPNHLALVVLARWRRFTMLLSADAEAESTPIDPGPVDVLKVAHHGSEDAGLGELLARARPGLAVVSVGEDNPYGHPAPDTLATLAAHGVRVLRTDRDGTISLTVSGDSLRLEAGR